MTDPIEWVESSRLFQLLQYGSFVLLIGGLAAAWLIWGNSPAFLAAALPVLVSAAIVRGIAINYGSPQVGISPTGVLLVRAFRRTRVEWDSIVAIEGKMMTYLDGAFRGKVRLTEHQVERTTAELAVRSLPAR